MAAFLEIAIVERTRAKATYTFTRVDGAQGVLEFDLEHGVATLVRGMPGDGDEWNFRRAERKLFLAWRDTGRTPDRCVWAS